MSVVTNIKETVKKSALGLYLVNLRKRFLYQYYEKRYSDKEFVSRLYKKRLGRSPDLDTPKLFTEKMQWMKLYYRDERIPLCSDKYEAKRYIEALGLSELLIPTLAVFDSAETFDATVLPKQFIVKATHGSGWNILCKDKDALDWSMLKKTMNVWLHQNLYIYGREWNYKEQTPRLLVEPLMDDVPLVDYKFLCFNGHVKALQVNHEVNGKTHLDFYDDEWNKIENASGGTHPGSNDVLPKPQSFDEMKQIAEELAAPFPFVRVDLYNIHGKIYFGEMTFFPASGYWKFTPPELDRVFGDWLTLPEKNHD